MRKERAVHPHPTPHFARDIAPLVLGKLNSSTPAGIILSGIVGSGKTTLIRDQVIPHLSEDYAVFQFTGDDLHFRSKVQADTKYIYEAVTSKTTRRAFVFVDEVQKCDEVFDAIKFAFDHLNMSFVVSGSNPEYLNTIAKKRLQRRAEFLVLTPFSLPEILTHDAGIDPNAQLLFSNFVASGDFPNLSKIDLTLTRKIETIIKRYLRIGGFPLSWKSETEAQSLIEIQKVVERGFEPLLRESEDVSDMIRIELAQRHSQEFSLKSVFAKTGMRSRDQVNAVITQLQNHGYLLRKKPVFIHEEKRSYLCIYSYCDPGIVSYVSGDLEIKDNSGYRIEGLVHSRLVSILGRIPLKSELGYYKAHTIDVNEKVKFQAGEIDFVLRIGKRILPIEVKTTANRANIKAGTLLDFMKKYRISTGVILYGGVPFYDKGTQILYWPFWLI